MSPLSLSSFLSFTPPPIPSPPPPPATAAPKQKQFISMRSAGRGGASKRSSEVKFAFDAPMTPPRAPPVPLSGLFGTSQASPGESIQQKTGSVSWRTGFAPSQTSSVTNSMNSNNSYFAGMPPQATLPQYSQGNCSLKLE